MLAPSRGEGLGGWGLPSSVCLPSLSMCRGGDRTSRKLLSARLLSGSFPGTGSQGAWAGVSPSPSFLSPDLPVSFSPLLRASALSAGSRSSKADLGI